MRIMLIAIAIVGTMFGMFSNAIADTAFTEASKKIAIEKLDKEVAKSEANSSENKGLSNVFKFTTLLMAISAAATTAYAATLEKVPRFLKAFTGFTVVATGALTGFANTDYDFGNREAVWRERSLALQHCQEVINRYATTEDFADAFYPILKWGDRQTLADLKGSCSLNKN